MDFKSLRYVIAVAEKGGVTAAAKSLGISQPSLSKYLQNLSESLGIPLFERGENGLTPTYAGERYIAMARRMLAMTEELKNVGPETERRQLNIACLPFEGSYIHPFAIRRFAESNPDVRLSVTETLDLATPLRAGEAAFAITTNVLSGEDIVHTRLIRDEVVLAAAKDHPLGEHAMWRENCAHPWVDADMLAGVPFVKLNPDQRIRALSDDFLSRERLDPRVVLQTRSVLFSIQVALSGVAACFAPNIGLRHYRFSEPPAFYSVGDPLLMDVYLARLKDSPLGGEAQSFVKLMVDFLR